MKRITYKEIYEKFDQIDKKIENINQRDDLKKSDLINFLFYRMNQLNEDLRTIYTAFWQKFSVILAFSYGIISLILASAAILGVEPVIKIFKDPEFIKILIGPFIFLFFINILIPTILRSIDNCKQRECLLEYEKVISKLLFEKKFDEQSLIREIKNLEKKRTLTLTSYIKLKIKQQWIRERKQISDSLKKN